jgi:Htaa
MTRSVIAGAAAALLLAAAPAAAQADTTLASGTTTLKLDAGVAKALKAAGVKVSGTTYKITGGRLDGATGTITHSGSLKLAAGSTKLSLGSFTVKLAKKSTLSGKVGKARVTLLTLDTSKAKIARSGLDYRITGVRVALTSAAAKALNATFHTTLFKKGLELGSVAVHARPKTVELTGGATTLALDQGAANALQSLGITAAPIGGTALSFPVTGGNVDAKTFAGTITHSGGISLTKGSTTVALADFEIGIDDTPELTALVGGTRVAILTVDLSALKASVDDGKVTLSGAALKLTAAAAGALNQAFGTTAFTEGLLLGTATVEAMS